MLRKNKISSVYSSVFIVVLTGLALLWISCSKIDGSYYNYQNQVKVFKGSAFAFLQSQPDVYDSFLLVINRFPQIKDSISNDSVTIIAPPNRSFTTALDNLNAIRTIQNKPKLSLSTIDSSNLDTLLCRYVIRGKITSDMVKPYIDGIDVFGIKYGYRMHFLFQTSTASGAVDAGPQSLIVSDTKLNPFTSYWIETPTSTVDIFSDNGIVHTLTLNHEFGFGEFSTRLNK